MLLMLLSFFRSLCLKFVVVVVVVLCCITLLVMSCGVEREGRREAGVLRCCVALSVTDVAVILSFFVP